MEHRKSKLDAISERKQNYNKSADQNAIEKIHSCLVKTILKAAEKTIPKTFSETKKKPPKVGWNKECEREGRIVRAE